MYNKIFFSICLFIISLASYAQNETNLSPYSRYYAGEFYKNASSAFAASGNVSVPFADYSILNISNPASYSFIEEFKPIFSIDFQNKWANLETANSNQKATIFNFSKFALGLPVSKKIGISFGIMPLTTVGYNIKNTQVVANIGNVDYLYQGSGGLNRFYVGGAYKILSNDTNTISLGINVSYGFGSYTNSRKVNYNNTNYYNSVVERGINLKGLLLDFGATYRAKFGKNNYLTAGAVIRPASKFTAKENYFSANYTINPFTEGETINDTLKSIVDGKGDIILPGFISFGLSTKLGTKWEIAGQINANNNIYYKENLATTSYNDSLANNSSVGLSVIHTPKDKYNLNNNILNRISYRFGIRYEDKAIQIENNYSADFGMSFGVDIPISVTSSSKDQYKSMSQIHLGVDYGSRGTTANGLIKENTTTFLVGFSMIPGNTDRWFRKRKIN